MKLILSPISTVNGQRRAGATLIEMMFAISILIMVVIAMMSAHLMGLRQNQLVESKGGASDTSRRVLNQLPADIRSAKTWYIGNMSGTNFVKIAGSSAQRGSALQLFKSSIEITNILYYFDLTDTNNSNGRLMRTVSDAWNPVCLASNLVDWLGGGYQFVGEDYAGTVATNQGDSKSYKNVIHTKLQFCQFQYPLTPVGTNGLYDFYKLEFKATPHLPE
jgi:type II secretory pathway component PulJ